MNRVYFFASLVVVSMLVLIGCGGNRKSSSGSGATVTVWHWMTDKQPIFDSLAARYEKQTGVGVRFELYAPSDAYTQKVRAASQANKLPDIFGLLAEKHDLASFVRAGYVLELSSYLDANNGQWRNELSPKALSHNQFAADNEYKVNPGYYGIPIDLMTIQMVYNKELFARAGLDPQQPPKTWDDFLKAGKALNAAKIPVFVSGFAEIWMMDCLASNLAFNILGEEKTIDTYRGKVPYTDPDWITVLTLFRTMADNNMFVKGITNFTNKEAEQMFANGKAAIAFNGSWCVNVYPEMNPKLDYGVFQTPSYSSKYPMRMWGSAGASFMVNASSPGKENAVAFLRWLTSSEQQSFYATRTNNIPSNVACLNSISPILSKFASAFENSTHPTKWPIMETASVIEAFDKGIQLIVIGEKTPEEIARHVQSVKDEAMRNK